MSSLLALGRAAAPLAFDLTLKISLATGASLLAVQLVGRRRPARCFALIAAAFMVGTVAAAVPSPILTFGISVAEPSSQIVSAPPLPPERRLSIADVRAVDIGIMTLPAPSAPVGRASVDWLGLFGLTWLVGVISIGAYLLLGALVLRRLLASTTIPCTDERLLSAADTARIQLRYRHAPRLLLSSNLGSAYAAGLFWPAIVLPQDALRWPDGRVASALLHESMHVKRRDNLVTELLRIATALAWCSPLAWLSLGSAIRLREEACDEAVLGAGVAPVRYAGDLLEAARLMSSSASTVASLVGKGDLERRIRAILCWSHQAVRPFARLRDVSAAFILIAAACVTFLVGAASPEKGDAGAAHWDAVTQPPSALGASGASISRGTFSASPSEGGVKLRIGIHGRSTALFVPARALPSMLPLGPRARLVRHFGNYRDPKTKMDYFNPGWELRDNHSEVVASAAGTVVSNRASPDEGPTIEIDHGFGLRTRYGLGIHGSSSLLPGAKVSAGAPIGSLGPSRSSSPGQFGSGLPDVIPVLRFLVLADVGGSELVALDPAPLVFAATANQSAPLTASVLNAAIRTDNGDEVSRLIALGIGLNTIATDGTIPLEWTVLTQNVQLAKTLVAAGASPSARIGAYGRKFTVADMARVTGNPDLISVFAPL